VRKWLASHPIHLGVGALLAVAVAVVVIVGLADEDTEALADPNQTSAEYCYRNSGNSWHPSEQLIECWWGAYIGEKGNGGNEKNAESRTIDLEQLIAAVNAKWPDAKVGMETTTWLDAWGGSGGGIQGGTATWGQEYLGAPGGMAQTITTPAALASKTLYWYQGDKGTNEIVAIDAVMGPGSGGAASLLTTKPISEAFASQGEKENSVTGPSLSQYGVLLVAGGGGGGGGSGPCNNGKGAHRGGHGGGAIATTSGPISAQGIEGKGASSNNGHGGGPEGAAGGGFIHGNAGFGGWGGHGHSANTPGWNDVDAVDPGAEEWKPAGQGAASHSETNAGGAGGGGYGGGGAGRNCFDSFGTSERPSAGGGGGGSYAAASTAIDSKAPTAWVTSPSSLPSWAILEMNAFPTDAALIVSFSLEPGS
jgi:hypothetical protein